MAKEVIVLRAFKCTFNRWFDVDYGVNDAWAETVYAETASKARMKFWRESERDREWIMKINVRRSKWNDLVAQEPHPIAATISPAGLDKMKHAWGFDSRNCGYRNRYAASGEDADWNILVECGLAGTQKDKQYTWYFLTELGIEVLRSLKPIGRTYVDPVATP